MSTNQNDDLCELTEGQLSQVHGGGIVAGIGIITAYVWVLDLAWEFGEGLGAGFYDATHR